jgi:phosphoribosylanthranilate isomerase
VKKWFEQEDCKLSVIPPFRVKLCGLKTPEDVRSAVSAGCDAIGLNFFEKSPRFVDMEAAIHLAHLAKGRCLRVGVFVNPTREQLQRVLEGSFLDILQLHGDETPELLEGLADAPLRILKAISYRGTVDDFKVRPWHERGRAVGLVGFLVDAHDPIARGGTGRAARWDLLFPRPQFLAEWPLILAGGLNDRNVAKAIQISKPDGVDTASGVEITTAIKSPSLMAAFVAEAHRNLPPPP